MKKALITLFALISIIIVALFASKTFAANIDGNGEYLTTSISRTTLTNEDGTTTYNYTMYVLLPSKNEAENKTNFLTKEGVISLLEKKYKQGIVSKIYKADGTTEITENQEKVGTGSIVELTTGKKITIVLYGDVTGDGIVNLYDTVAIAKHNVRVSEITDDYKFKSAELTGEDVDGIITLNDTTRVAFYNVGLVGINNKYGKYIIDKELYPEDFVDEVNLDKLIKDTANKSENFHISFSFDNDKAVGIKVEKREEKLSEVIEESLTKYITELFKTEKIKSITLNTQIADVSELTINKSDYENISEIFKTYFTENSDKIFARENYEDVIMGDFANKKFSLKIDLQDDLVLKDEQKEDLYSKTYDLEFTANPIKLTFNLGYEGSKDIKQEQTDAGLVQKPQDPTRTEERQEEGKEKRTIKYKFLGWYLKNGDNIEEEAFDFENTKVEYDTTFVAKWSEIVDEDYEINDVIDEINGKESAKQDEARYNIGFVGNKNINIGILKGDEQLDQVFGENSNILKFLKSSLEEERIEKIVIKYKDQEITFTKDDVNVKMKELLNLIYNSETNEKEDSNRKLSDLLHVKLEMDVVLNNEYTLKEGETAKYSIEFNETLNLDNWVEKLINSDKVGKDYFEFTYNTESNSDSITAKVKNRAQNLSSLEGKNTNILEALSDLVTATEIKSVNITVPNTNKKLELTKSEGGERIKSIALEWIKENLKDLDEGNQFNGVILGDLYEKSFQIKIELEDNVQINDGHHNGEKNRTYTVKFTADPIKLTYEYGTNGDNKTETKTQEKAGTVGKANIPQTALKNKDEKQYKLVGWYKKTDEDSHEDTVFDFDSTKVEYDTTFVAKWNEVIDVDKKITNAVEEVNKKEQESSIFDIDKKEDDLTFEFKQRDKKVSDIQDVKIEEILDKILKNEGIEEITIKIEGSEEEYHLKITEDKKTCKEELINLVKKLIQDEYAEENLTDLLGKKLSLTVKLDSNKAVINDDTYEGAYEKTYSISFVELLKKGEIIENVLKDNQKDDNYKAEYEEGTLTVIPKSSGESIAETNNQDESNILTALVGDSRIEKIELKYGKDKEHSVDLKTLVTNGETAKIDEKLKEYLKENWQEFCTCTKDCCDGEVCSWDKAKNECLINCGDFELEITLAETEEFALGGERTATYKIDFKRDDVKIQLNFKNGDTNTVKDITIKESEGLPVSEENITACMKEEQVNYPTWEEHEFNYWASDEKGTKYDYNKKVTSSDGDADLKLYGTWWLILNTDEDIENSITENKATLKDKYEETFETTPGNIEANNVTIDVRNTDQNIDTVLDTGLGKALEKELQKDGVTAIEVSYEGKDSNTTKVTFDGTNKEASMTTLFNAIETDSVAAQTKAVANTNLKLTQLLGKSLTAEVKYDKNKVKLDKDPNLVTTYKINFIKYVTYKDINDIGQKMITSYINNHASTHHKVTLQDDKTIIVDCTNKKNATLLEAAQGCGAKTAIFELIKKDPINAISVKEEGKSVTPVRLARGMSESDMLYGLLECFTGKKGFEAMMYAYGMNMKDWIDHNLEITVELLDGYEWKGNIEPLKYQLQIIAN